MKIKSTIGKALLTLVMLSVVATSCRKNFDEINTNPNSPAGTLRLDFLLTGSIKGLADNTNDAFWGAQHGMQLAQYWSSNQYASESRYDFRTAVVNAYWRYLYAGGINDMQNNVGGMSELQTIIDECTATPSDYAAFGDPDNQIAVALILRTWAFQHITDVWGDAPYSDALKGSASPNPAYDSQRDIYFGLIADLNSALGKINEGATGPTGDVIFNGNMTQWKSFANSLKLRVAMRMADREPVAAGTAVSEAVADGVITSNADNALLTYKTTDPNFSMYYFNRYIDARQDYAGSNILIDKLQDLTDPRLPLYVEPATATDTFVGEVYGLTDENATLTAVGDVSQPATSVLAADWSAIFMDYAQVQFLLAEAVERGYIGGSASDYYNAGITGSFEYWGAGDATTYIAQANVDYATLIGGGMTWREVIGQQKWIALYMQGMEGWSEWRRLDFGILQLPADGVLDGEGIALRMYYPVDEQTLNGINYSAAAAAIGGDTQDTKVWWDMN